MSLAWGVTRRRKVSPSAVPKAWFSLNPPAAPGWTNKARHKVLPRAGTGQELPKIPPKPRLTHPSTFGEALSPFHGHFSMGVTKKGLITISKTSI